LTEDCWQANNFSMISSGFMSSAVAPLISTITAAYRYRLDEECRLGHAILKYSPGRPLTLRLYSLGTAEGTMARTIAELAAGRVETLSCSPNIENFQSFCAYGEPPHASFFVGPFHHLTVDLLDSRADLIKFTSDFDIILEYTNFQMYSPSRADQIGFVSQRLKDDGLFLFFEKFKDIDIEEYSRREDQKDHGFKARYFRRGDIERKEASVLTVMNRNEVTLGEMEAATRQYSRHCHITWNSGNFYSLVASNSLPNIERFLSNLIKPAIPNEYVYEPFQGLSWVNPRSWTNELRSGNLFTSFANQAAKTRLVRKLLVCEARIAQEQ
jgi:hypothetical protein